MQIFRLAEFFGENDFVHADKYLPNLENPEGRKWIMYTAALLLSSLLFRRVPDGLMSGFVAFVVLQKQKMSRLQKRTKKNSLAVIAKLFYS